MDVRCPVCNAKPVGGYGLSETLVGYGLTKGSDGQLHEHDDNCRKMLVECPQKHRWTISERRRCETEGCGWRGKTECFCHQGKKLDRFPSLPILGAFPLDE
jgi:hypothetical protein